MAQSSEISVLLEGGADRSELSLSLHTHTENAMWGYTEEGFMCKLGRELSPETEFASILIMDC